jgi:hypothetical protein
MDPAGADKDWEPPDAPLPALPDIDPNIWDQVLERHPIPGLPSHDEDENSSSDSSFESETDSDADAQPVDDGGLAFNPATYGLRPETLLRERSAVEQVINGETLALMLIFIC